MRHIYGQGRGRCLQLPPDNTSGEYPRWLPYGTALGSTPCSFGGLRYSDARRGCWGRTGRLWHRHPYTPSGKVEWGPMVGVAGVVWLRSVSLSTPRCSCPGCWLLDVTCRAHHKGAGLVGRAIVCAAGARPPLADRCDGSPPDSGDCTIPLGPDPFPALPRGETEGRGRG